MYKSLFTLFLCLIVLFSCRKKDDFITNSDAKLEFSVDTLHFDTVFTTVGSATRIIKVYNTHRKDIQISRITVRENNNSRFRFNIDGIVFDGEATDIEIAGNDSLYIFAEVTVNPDQDTIASPFVITDALVFETNGNTQEVVLDAWGQNANYIPNRYNNGGLAYLSCGLGEVIWDDPKPYVIYGILIIDSCTLVLPEGCQIYIHGGLARQVDEEGQSSFYNDGAMLFFADGKLRVEGTKENPVTIQGDRLEEGFQDVSGQWAGIRLGAGSTGNDIDHMILKNSIVGVIVDSAAQLDIKNTQIINTQSIGLAGLHGEINAANCLFHSNGAGCLNIFYGGKYNFDFCTFASYGVDAAAVQLSNALCLDQLCSEFRANPLDVTFRNSIIFGSRTDEITLFDPTQEDDFVYKMENCLVRVDELTGEDAFPDFFDHCNPCLNEGIDALVFLDVDNGDFHLDSLSVVNEQAEPIPGLELDLDGVVRDATNPDMGCYENTF